MKTANRPSVEAVVGRKALIHGVAHCMVCDWLCEDYLTVQRKARQHTRKTGHRVSMELGYDVTITANAPNQARSEAE